MAFDTGHALITVNDRIRKHIRELFILFNDDKLSDENNQELSKSLEKLLECEDIIIYVLNDEPRKEV